MAKGKLTQQDLMIWVMAHPNGTKLYYLIEKEPFEQEGLKKAVHRVGSTGDAVFQFRDQAEAALAQFPPGEEVAVGAAAEERVEEPAEA